MPSLAAFFVTVKRSTEQEERNFSLSQFFSLHESGGIIFSLFLLPETLCLEYLSCFRIS
jgi:hypothetical protein